MDPGVLAIGQPAEVLLRAVAERLTLLQRVDRGKPDLALSLAGVEDGDRVPVGDTDHPAGQGVGEGRGRGQQEAQERSNDPRPRGERWRGAG